MARVNRFDTSLNMRVDIEASMAYWLGLFSGAFLLIVERKNDYVRYHAWQSSLFSVFTILLSTFFALLSWTALETIVTVVSIVGLMVCAFKAYKQGGTLDRFKLPVIGQVADRWVEEE
ncbi:hypothetical protein GQ42DRAFT_120272 [Ramicandelaber brevisporus]|nr:hypothetical protein GQ42DRAFT_120272 [Ramicandelaber brevisporus]